MNNSDRFFILEFAGITIMNCGATSSAKIIGLALSIIGLLGFTASDFRK